MDLRNKRILVTGANGQLGSAIVNVLMQNNFDVIGTDRRIMDITNYVEVSSTIKKFLPQVIIHCAAYTFVDKAEEDKNNCYKVNVDGTRNLAILAEEHDIEFIYFSTDYVFDGKKTDPFNVLDIPSPINYYGLTKYIGEEVVKSLIKKYYIFRISWVYGPNGKNFVNTIINLSKEKTSINVVIDQIGSPTYTIDVAKFLMAEQNFSFGTYHLTNEGFISWYEFAVKILELSKSTCIVKPILSSDFKTLAKRALNSRLYKENLTLLGYWEHSLKKYLHDYLGIKIL